MPDDDDDERYMSCYDCKVSMPVTDDFDFAAWIAAHPLHSCTMGDEPHGQPSLF